MSLLDELNPTEMMIFAGLFISRAKFQVGGNIRAFVAVETFQRRTMMTDEKKPKKPRRFPGLAKLEMLNTPEEIADLRRRAKEALYLRPAKADKKD